MTRGATWGRNPIFSKTGMFLFYALDLGAACHSTSTKVRDEGLSRPRTITITNSFRRTAGLSIHYYRDAARSATISHLKPSVPNLRSKFESFKFNNFVIGSGMKSPIR